MYKIFIASPLFPEGEKNFLCVFDVQNCVYQVTKTCGLSKHLSLKPLQRGER